MPATTECFPQFIEELWHPCGMHHFVSSFPGVSAALRLPAPEEQREAWADFAEIRSWRQTSTAADFGEIGPHFWHHSLFLSDTGPPRADETTFWHPSGMNRKPRIQTVRFLHSPKMPNEPAMQPGITGATKGIYGTPENAGAGLFITRCIAKGTGGYFLLASGDAVYRLRRSKESNEMITLFRDPFDDKRHDLWTFPSKWPGTAVSIEINTERIADYEGFFLWIFQRVPSRTSQDRKIRFT